MFGPLLANSRISLQDRAIVPFGEGSGGVACIAYECMDTNDEIVRSYTIFEYGDSNRSVTSCSVLGKNNRLLWFATEPENMSFCFHEVQDQLERIQRRNLNWKCLESEYLCYQ